MEAREVIVGSHDDAGRPRPFRNTINGCLAFEPTGCTKVYESFAFGFDDRVMKELYIDGELEFACSIVAFFRPEVRVLK
jgi:hypothetical protein